MNCFAVLALLLYAAALVAVQASCCDKTCTMSYEPRAKTKPVDYLFIIDISSKMNVFIDALGAKVEEILMQSAFSQGNARYAVAVFGGQPTLIQTFTVRSGLFGRRSDDISAERLANFPHGARKGIGNVAQSILFWRRRRSWTKLWSRSGVRGDTQKFDGRRAELHSPRCWDDDHGLRIRMAP
jgi:hypothetical protein